MNKVNAPQIIEFCDIVKKYHLFSPPRMTDEIKAFAEELYKAHFTPTEAARLLSFGYGSVAGLWQQFKYAKVKKYDRLDLIYQQFTELRGDKLANADSR